MSKESEELDDILKKLLEGTPELDEFQQAVLDTLINFDVDAQRSRAFALTVNRKDWENLNEPQIRAVLRDWASTRDFGETQRRLAMYEVMTRPAREQEQLRQAIQRRYGTSDPEMLKMLGEQQAIIAGEDIRQRQARERYAKVEERAQKMVRPYPSYSEMTYPAGTFPFGERAAEAVSPRFREWSERELPSVYSERRQQEFREAQLEAGREIARDYYMAWSDEPGEKERKRELKALVKRKSPWEELLASPSFLQGLESRFRALPARERGYFSSQFRPRTRFLG